MTKIRTCEEWEATLGERLRELRLQRNVDQRQLAAQAGVALNAVKRLESGKGATITSLVKVLRILDRVEWIDALKPAVSVSPMQMLKARPARQRASPARGRAHV